MDSIIRMVFLNFTYEDKKIMMHQWNDDFEKMAKLPSLQLCRAEATNFELIVNLLSENWSRLKKYRLLLEDLLAKPDIESYNSLYAY